MIHNQHEAAESKVNENARNDGESGSF